MFIYSSASSLQYYSSSTALTQAARAKLPPPPLPATPNQAHSFRPPEFDSSDCPLALPLRLLPPAAGAAGAPSAIKLSDAAAHPAPSEGGGLPG